MLKLGHKGIHNDSSNASTHFGHALALLTQLFIFMHQLRYVVVDQLGLWLKKVNFIYKKYIFFSILKNR